MNRALWEKTFREGQWLLLGSALLLVAFHWIRVWITSQFRVPEVARLLRHVPDFIQEFFAVPVHIMATPAGRIAIGYDDPLVLVVICIWAIARGSDSVSGEIGRGTMELLLAQPVRRFHVLSTHSVVTILGALILAIAAWFGTLLGLATIALEDDVPGTLLLPAAVNLFAVGVFVAGLTTMLSSLDRYRSRTIGIIVGFVVVQMIFKLVSLSVPTFSWLRRFTFLSLFEPQKLTYAFWPEVLEESASESWQMLLQYNGLLLVLGMAGFVAATAIFCRRDLPAPL